MRVFHEWVIKTQFPVSGCENECDERVVCVTVCV